MFMDKLYIYIFCIILFPLCLFLDLFLAFCLALLGSVYSRLALASSICERDAVELILPERLGHISPPETNVSSCVNYYN